MDSASQTRGNTHANWLYAVSNAADHPSGWVNHYAYEIPKNALGIPASTFVQHQINDGAALDDVIVLKSEPDSQPPVRIHYRAVP